MKHRIHGKYVTFSDYLELYPCTQTGDGNFIISISYEGNHRLGIMLSLWSHGLLDLPVYSDYRLLGCDDMQFDMHQCFEGTCYLPLQSASSTLKTSNSFLRNSTHLPDIFTSQKTVSYGTHYHWSLNYLESNLYNVNMKRVFFLPQSYM
jgi:hypothetical protein